MLVFVGSSFLFAQEMNEDSKMQKDRLHWSLGLLLEGNMNVPKDCALGTGLYGMVVLPDWVKVGRFSAGAKLLYSTGFKRYSLLDTALLFRWNFYDFEKLKKVDLVNLDQQELI